MEGLKTGKTGKTGSWYYSTHGESSENHSKTCLMCLFTRVPLELGVSKNNKNDKNNGKNAQN